jgi:periplasmic divalent cation tolerance protein
MGIALAYITNQDKKEAKRIASHLLKKRIIACANIFPVNSLYWWKGKIVNDKEYVLIAKTTEKNLDRLQKEVEKIHSYTIPCIINITAGSNKKFKDWLIKEIDL